MSHEIAEAYDAVAEEYASRFLRDLVDDAEARPWLDDFVDLVAPAGGPVVDVGCGPGQGVDVLVQRGVPAFGIDLSPAQIAQARSAFPANDYRIGDLTSLEVDDGSLGGILSRYSIIHLRPRRLETVFGEWRRVLAPGAPALVFFFASLAADDHGRPFDHTVATAYELFPATLGARLERAGFTKVRYGSAPAAPGGRPFEKGAVLARRGSG